MDNASKALIMAGAILIAVALVGLGVYLFNNASNTIYDATGSIDTTKVQQQNAQFERYADTNVKGGEVKSLIRAVGAFNANNIFPDDINFTGFVTGNTAVAANNIDDRDYFTVTMTGYDATTGALTTINIERTRDL